MKSQIAKSNCTTDGTSVQVMMGQSYSCEVELTDNPSTFMTFLLRQEEDSLYFEPLAAWHSDLYMLDTQMIC